jgi:hypothetical protein
MTINTSNNPDDSVNSIPGTELDFDRPAPAPANGSVPPPEDYLLHLPTPAGAVSLAPFNITLIREQRRARVAHHVDCPSFEGSEGLCAQCEQLGCITPLPSVVELLLVNTLGRESSVTTELPYLVVCQLYNDAIAKSLRLVFHQFLDRAMEVVESQAAVIAGNPTT